MRLLLFCLGIALTISAHAQMVSNAEYFLDTDPGVGNGTAIPSFTPGNVVDLNVNVDLNGVAEGFHQIFIRFKDASGTWGIYEGRTFYIQPALLGNSSALVADAEYFFDTDPGFGNGTAIPAFSAADTVDLNLNLDLTGLPSGFHQVFIRFRQDNGLWGIYEGRTFYVQPAPIGVNNAQLTEAEYFFDTDPGYGSGIALPAFTMADTVDLVANLDVSGVTTGVPHQVYIRFKNENGTWGIYEGREFTRLDCDIPAPDFSFVNPVCPGTAITFSDLSTIVNGTTNYEWDIDNNGTVDYTNQGDITHTYNTPGNYDVELKLTNGSCVDSIAYNLTVQPTFTEAVSVDACYNSSITFADGNTVNNIVANFSQTSVVTSSLGCDSTIITNVSVLPESTGTDVQIACNSFTWIDGNTYTSSNNSATFILQNSEGCDSTVTLDLTINVPTFGTDTQTACNSFTWIDGNTYTSSNNTAQFTLTNAAGCDSIVTLDLTINSILYSTDAITSCSPITWIDGNTYSASNNTATYQLTSSEGCDSIVTLNLTINSPTTGTDTQTACSSYTWIDGNTYTSSNNTATWTLTNAAGCDSIVTLDLTINVPTTATDIQSACISYTWIDGNTYTASNNTAIWTLTNAAGCDSVVTLDLTINQPNTGVDVQQACATYTWIDGNTYTSSNNSATFTLQNAAGCDSVVTLELTIGGTIYGTDVITACDTYTWIDGNSYSTSNSTATHLLTTSEGCDSVVTLNLTMNYSNTGTDVQTACDSYTWIDGNTYTTSNNTTTWTLTNAAGCDSVVTLNLTIQTVNTLITNSDPTLTADLVGATSYQWIDCNNGNQPINGETSQSYNATLNGEYAVIITDNGCSDTSACEIVQTVGIDENELSSIQVYPNPTNGELLVDVGQSMNKVQIDIVDAKGRLILSESFVNEQVISLSLTDCETGVYFLNIQSDYGKEVLKVIRR